MRIDRSLRFNQRICAKTNNNEIYTTIPEFNISASKKRGGRRNIFFNNIISIQF